MKIDKEFIDKSIKPFWNKVTNKELFVSITDFIKQKEKNIELIEKYDELLYKLNITLFSNKTAQYSEVGMPCGGPASINGNWNLSADKKFSLRLNSTQPYSVMVNSWLNNATVNSWDCKALYTTYKGQGDSTIQFMMEKR